ncbi:sigma-54 dependent transcriptional regulator [Halioxenophilus sp. WMMB6]|uniref:sigma-54 dependent transcriptional regulator n=1 Tax=Halioxenophilus sp. WMMB6 TaxID=3073815 RepID=UPI00295E6790|nr:sigma-54 dependent transcriptional regulator [Halioxenophilus sp. WMMB6]
MATPATVLIIDSHKETRAKLQQSLQHGYELFAADSLAQAEKLLADQWIQIVVCAGEMLSDGQFIADIKSRWPELQCIVLGEAKTIAALAQLQSLVYQFIAAPWQGQHLRLTVANAFLLFQLQRQNETLNLELKMAGYKSQQSPSERESYHFKDGIVRSPQSPMNDICEHLYQVAPYDISVLLTGESGTGKELAARALHNNSLRWDKPFVVENCGALPDDLLESELFGCKRGAFTGAVEDRPGLFQRADGGTVFLDEIGEISPAFQVKLLRVLQEGEVRPLGGSQPQRIDVRVITATNKNLEQAVAAGQFREDLYYRIAPVTIALPPLRERPDDIPLLADCLLDQAIKNLGKPAQGFTAEVYRYLQAYPWPGNVRELQNEISRMLVTSRAMTLGAELLNRRVSQALASSEPTPSETLTGTLKDRVEALEAKILRETLVRLRWNKSKAANELGLSRVGLRSKVERYGIHRSSPLEGSAKLVTP